MIGWCNRKGMGKGREGGNGLDGVIVRKGKGGEGMQCVG